MKKILLLSFSMILSAMHLSGQAGSVGFTNIDAIVFSMPEIEKISTDIESYRSALSDQLNLKNEQFNLYLEAFQKLKDDPTTPDSVMQAKQVDFINRQSAVQDYKAEAEQLLSNKQAELYNPVYEKVRQAIEDVRIDKGLGIVINTHAGSNAGIILAYSDEADITRAVFEKLGVPYPEPKETEQADGNN